MATFAEYMATLGAMTPTDVGKKALKFVVLPAALIGAGVVGGRYTAPSTVQKGNATVEGVEMFRYNDFIFTEGGVVKVDNKDGTFVKTYDGQGKPGKLKVKGILTELNPTTNTATLSLESKVD